MEDFALLSSLALADVMAAEVAVTAEDSVGISGMDSIASDVFDARADNADGGVEGPTGAANICTMERRRFSLLRSSLRAVIDGGSLYCHTLTVLSLHAP